MHFFTSTSKTITINQEIFVVKIILQLPQNKKNFHANIFNSKQFSQELITVLLVTCVQVTTSCLARAVVMAFHQ